MEAGRRKNRGHINMTGRPKKPVDWRKRYRTAKPPHAGALPSYFAGVTPLLVRS